MKKLIAALMALSLSASVFAVGFGVGIKGDIGGTNMLSKTTTTISGAGAIDGTTTTKYDSKVQFTGAVGAVIEVDITDNFTIQPEIVYRFNNGNKITVDTTVITTKFQSIEVPVLFEDRISAGPGKIILAIGPTFNFFLDSIEIKTDSNSVTKPTSDIMKTFSFGGVIGAGYELPLGPGALTLNGRFYADITNLEKIDKDVITISTYTRTTKNDTRRIHFTGDVAYIYKF